MNYSRIYDSIISNAQKQRHLDYSEKHHIIPKCIGGTDDINNIVVLSAREHFIAHALLVQIYKHTIYAYKLAAAFNYMCSYSHNNKRYNSRMFSMARKLFSEYHPCKQQHIRDKIRYSVSDYYKNNKHSSYIDREIRICSCGCGESFIVKITSKQRLKKYHKDTESIEKMAYGVSNSLSKYIAELSPEDAKKRLDNSLRSCDHIARGKAISEGKKGKKTNQSAIESEKYGKMSDDEFSNFISNRKEFIKKRMITKRNKYLHEHNDHSGIQSITES